MYEEYQADLNIRGEWGGTAIWRAAYYDYDSMVEMLAGWGAHMEIKNDAGKTPVGIAAARGKLQLFNC